MSTQGKYHINLVSRKEMTAVDKTLYFFLHYVRYILVITQLTVIGVLFFRFKIDQSIIDLRDSIDQKKEIIKVFEPAFKEADRVNTQLKEITTIINGQTMQNQSIEYLLSRFPRDVFLRKFDLNDDTYTLTGTTLNSQVLREYYALLKRENKFKIVELSNIRRDDNGYSFVLKAAKFTL